VPESVPELVTVSELVPVTASATGEVGRPQEKSSERCRISRKSCVASVKGRLPMQTKATNEAKLTGDLEITLTFDQTPEEVFAAVTNVRGWWSEGLQGQSEAPGDEFTYRHGSVHQSKHRVLQVEPGKLVTWDTLDADLTHAKNPREWIGTKVRFEITKKATRTQLRFVHDGLVPELDCFESCSKGWWYYVGTSLKQLIETGYGRPDAKEAACETVA